MPSTVDGMMGVPLFICSIVVGCDEQRLVVKGELHVGCLDLFHAVGDVGEWAQTTFDRSGCV